MQQVSPFENKVVSRIIIQKVSEVEDGDTITFAEISNQTGQKFTGSHPAWTTAREYLMKQGIYCKIIVGVGILRMNDDQKVDSIDDQNRRVHRASGRVINQASAVRNPGSLSAERQALLNVNLYRMHGIRHLTSQSTYGKIAALKPIERENPELITKNLRALAQKAF